MWGNYPGLSGWASVLTRGGSLSYKGKGGRAVRGGVAMDAEVERCGTGGRGMRVAHPTLELPEGTQHSQPISDI